MAWTKVCYSLVMPFVMAVSALPTSAEILPHPQDEPVLTVSGSIGAKNNEGEAVFDRALLKGLGLHTLRTSTTWTTGVRTFEGVLVRDLLSRVDARGTHATATALNDYSIKIPLSDFQKFDVLLALRMDGRDLTPRDKGPIWIVYPRDRNAELQDARYDHRWVWQLKSLTIH